MLPATSQRALAARLGVSPMTVSRAIRGSEGVSDAQRQRILRAARAIGLPVPAPCRQRAAPDLQHVLCTMAPDPRQASDSVFHQRLMEGLRRGAGECVSEIVNCDVTDQAWPLVVARRQVDGAVLVWGDEHDTKPAGPCPVPAVYVFYGPPHADVVTVDNLGGGFELGKHLAANGHRRVAFVGPDSRMSIERLGGLRAGLEGANGGVPPGLALLECGAVGSGARLADDLLAAARRTNATALGFTAVMAYNDYIAAQVIRRFAELGIRVPDHVSVVGFDGVAPAFYQGPPLCTCAIPLEDIGAEAVSLVYWRLQHPTAVRRRLVLEPRLVPGDSVARVEA